MSLSISFANDIHYLYGGNFNTDDISYAKAGDEWTRIDKDGNVATVKIKLSSWRGEDGTEEIHEGITSVNYDGSENSFIIKGLKINSKQIKLFKIQTPNSDITSNYFEFGTDKEKIHFYTSGKEILNEYGYENRTVKNYELKIKLKDEEIVLLKDHNAQYVDGTRPYSPKWAGDLNGDGLPDFVIGHPVHVSGAGESILLLSKAGKKTTYEKLAKIMSPGC